MSFLTNTKVLNEGGQLVFTAVVTDPDGVDDVIGGSLTNPAGDATYGAFSTSAAEGSYELRIDWSAINQVSAINGPVEGTERIFRAVFYDQQGNAATESVAIQLDCSDERDSICSGKCTDLMTSTSNCGACGRSVSALGQDCRGGAIICGGVDIGYSAICGDSCVGTSQYSLRSDHCGGCGNDCNYAGAEANSGYCFEGRCSARFVSLSRVSCKELCESHGKVCDYVSDSRVVYNQEEGLASCTEVPAANNSEGHDFSNISCVCHQPEAGSQCEGDCLDKVCGSDGCGSLCGICAPGSACSADGSACQPE